MKIGLTKLASTKTKKANMRTWEGCIFHLYEEQKPLGGLSPDFFSW